MKHILASDTINMSTNHDGFKMLKRKLGWPKHMGNKLLTLEREIMPTNKARSHPRSDSGFECVHDSYLRNVHIFAS